MVGPSSLGLDPARDLPNRGLHWRPMSDHRPWRLVSGLVGVVLVAACGLLPADARPGTVTIYGRNAPEEDGWFGLVTADDPPQVVGFGADGVGCLDGPPGTAIAWFDGAPGEGGQPKQLIGRIPADGSPVVLSVEVTPDGRLLVGHGVPVWWEGDPQVC